MGNEPVCAIKADVYWKLDPQTNLWRAEEMVLADCYPTALGRGGLIVGAKPMENYQREALWFGDMCTKTALTAEPTATRIRAEQERVLIALGKPSTFHLMDDFDAAGLQGHFEPFPETSDTTPFRVRLTNLRLIQIDPEEEAKRKDYPNTIAKLQEDNPDWTGPWDYFAPYDLRELTIAPGVQFKELKNILITNQQDNHPSIVLRMLPMPQT